MVAVKAALPPLVYFFDEDETADRLIVQASTEMAVDKALKESERANNRLDVVEKEKVSRCSPDGIVNTAVKKAMEAGGGNLNLDDSSERLFGGMVTPLPNKEDNHKRKSDDVHDDEPEDVEAVVHQGQQKHPGKRAPDRALAAIDAGSAQDH